MNILSVVEVELTPENLIQNIEKDLDSGCERVIIAVPNKRSIGTYKKKIKSENEELLDNIEFVVLNSFLS